MKVNLKKGWYVIYVRSRHERKVHESLINNKLQSFLPLIKTVKNWSDRKKLTETPLFPSYVFVKINSSKEFFNALSIDGVCDFIRFGREYALVKECEIENIKLLLSSDYKIGIEGNHQIPKVGELKKIEQGPLKGLECEILRINNKSKIVVRLDSIQQNITTIVPSEYLSEMNYGYSSVSA